MSSKVPIAYIDIRAFAHATEDVDKVLNAVYNTLPSESVEIVTFNRTALTGHHGNSIMLLEARIKHKALVQKTFEKISSGLGIMDKESLSKEIESHLDGGNLYLRLDKQSAYMNELRIGQTDSVHFRVHFKKHGVKEIAAICKGFGLLS